MSERIDYIPLDTINKIEIYENKNKKTLNQIVKETGCDFAITGVFYTYDWKPTCQLKSNGKILFNDGYNYWGFRWNTPKDFSMGRIPADSANYKNYFACCYLIVNGEKIKPNYNKDVGGKRGRTGVGLVDDKLVLYASSDGSSDAKTPEELRDYLYAKGVTSFTMNDGGGKVNYRSPWCTMQGKDKSQNLILIYLKNETSVHEEEKTTEESFAPTTQIVKRYATKNPRYKANQIVKKVGYVQHSTAIPGANAETIIGLFDKPSANAEAHFVIDDKNIYQILPLNIRAFHVGGSANTTHVGVEVCEPSDTRFIPINWKTLSKNGKNNTKEAVKALQNELVARGYDTNGVDGIFGGGTDKAVRQFQKDVGIGVDGMVGKSTLKKLQDRVGSYVKYDSKANQGYFENVYDKAVFTCGYVLKQIGVANVTNSNVISHAEAYQQGVGSNHADVGHWWPEHNKTMDDFREDVKNYLRTGKLPFEKQSNSIEPPMNELDKAWEKACKKGIFDGSNPNNPCTRRQVAVVLDRLGLLD